MSEDEHLHISVPARPESLDLVHPVLEQLWIGHSEVPLRERMRFETALVEIFANIVEHAYRADLDMHSDGRRLELRVAVVEKDIRATFIDSGEPVELDLSDVVMPDEESESGRGLAMAIAALDELRYERLDGRNHWHLLMHLPN